jgi:hypothetical protein
MVDQDMGTDLGRAEVRRQVEADTRLEAAAESWVVAAERRAEPDCMASVQGSDRTIQAVRMQVAGFDSQGLQLARDMPMAGCMSHW